MGQPIDFGGELGVIDFPDEYSPQQILEEINSDTFRAAAQKVGYDVTQLDFLRPQEPSWLGDIKSGFVRGKQKVDITFDVWAHEAGADTSEDLAKSLAKNMSELSQARYSKSVQEDLEEIFGNRDENASWFESFATTIGQLATRPRTALALTAESIVASIPGLASLAAGAIAAPATGGVSVAGGVAGMGLSSGAVEYANSMVDIADSLGYDVTDDASLMEFLGNEEAMSAARDEAAKRGVAIGAFDALSGGLAGRLFGPTAKIAAGPAGRAAAEASAKAAQEMAVAAGKKASGDVAKHLGRFPKVVGGAVEALAQGGYGAGGEITAGLITTGEADPAQAAAEFILEQPGGIAEIAIGQFGRRGDKTADDIIKETDAAVADNPDVEGVIADPSDVMVGMMAEMEDGTSSRVHSRIGDRYLVVDEVTGKAQLIDVGSARLYNDDMEPEEMAARRDKAAAEAISGNVPLENRLSLGNIARILGVTPEELEDQTVYSTYEDLRDFVLGTYNLSEEQAQQLQDLDAGTLRPQRQPNIEAPWEYLNQYGTRKTIQTPYIRDHNKIISALNVPNAPDYSPNDIIEATPEELQERIEEALNTVTDLRRKEIKSKNAAKSRGDTHLLPDKEANLDFLNQKLSELRNLKRNWGTEEKFFANVDDEIRKKPTRTKLRKLKQGDLAALAIEQGVPAKDIFDAAGQPTTKANLVDAIMNRHEADVPPTHYEPVQPDPRREPLETRRTRRAKVPEGEEVEATANPVAPQPDRAAVEVATPPSEEPEVEAQPEVRQVATPPDVEASQVLEKGKLPFNEDQWSLLEDAGFSLDEDRPSFIEQGIPAEYIKNAKAGKVFANGKWVVPGPQHLARLQKRVTEVMKMIQVADSQWERLEKKNPRAYLPEGPNTAAIFKELGYEGKRLSWKNYEILKMQHLQRLFKQNQGLLNQIKRAGQVPAQTAQAMQAEEKITKDTRPLSAREKIETDFMGPPEEIKTLKDRALQLEYQIKPQMRELAKHDAVLVELGRMVGLMNVQHPLPAPMIEAIRKALPQYSGLPIRTPLLEWRNIVTDGRSRIQADIDPVLREIESLIAGVDYRTTPTDIRRTEIEPSVEEEIVADMADMLELTPEEEAEMEAFVQGDRSKAKQMRSLNIKPTRLRAEYVNEFNDLAKEWAVNLRTDDLFERPVWISNEGIPFHREDDYAHIEVLEALSENIQNETTPDDGSGYAGDTAANDVAELTGGVRAYFDGRTVNFSMGTNELSPRQLRTVSEFVKQTQPGTIYIDVVNSGRVVATAKFTTVNDLMGYLRNLPMPKEMRIPRVRPSALVPAIRLWGRTFSSNAGNHTGAEIRLMDETGVQDFADVAPQAEYGYVNPDTGQFMRRNVAEATASLWNVPLGSYSWRRGGEYQPRFEGKARQIMRTARELAARMGVEIPLTVEERFSNTVTEGGKYDTVAYYDDYMINISLEALANDGRPPAHVIGHELIHYLKDAKIITPQEWAVLERDANKDNWIDEFGIKDKYPDLDYGGQLEEAIAEKFGEYLTPVFIPEDSGWAPQLVDIFGKIKKWIRALAAALGGQRFYKASDVFQDIYNGAFAGRQAKFELYDTNMLGGRRDMRMPSWSKAQRDMDRANRDSDNIRFPQDISKMNEWINTPKQIAHLDRTKMFSTFWWTAKQMKQYFNSTISESTSMLQPYGVAIKDPAKRQQLRKAMEVAQMREVEDNDVQVIEEPDRIIFVNGPNKGQGMHSSLRPNEVVELEGDVLEAYRSAQQAMRFVMSHMVDSHIAGNIGQFKNWWQTLDPEGEADGFHMSDLISSENPSEVEHILAKLDLGYIIRDGKREEVPPEFSDSEPLGDTPENMRPIVGWLTLLDHIENVQAEEGMLIQQEYDETVKNLGIAKALNNKEAIKALSEREAALSDRMLKLISAWDDGLALLRNSLEAYEKFMQNDHYFPKMRFGQYFFTLRDPDTNEVLWYSQVEVNPFKKSARGNRQLEETIAEAIKEARRQNPELQNAVYAPDDYGDNNLDRLRQDLRLSQGLDYIRRHARVDGIDTALESLSVEAIKSGPLGQRATNDYHAASEVFDEVAQMEHKDHLRQARDAAVGIRRNLLNDMVESSLFKSRSAGFAKQLWQPRKHVPGYDVDFERAIATYLTGAARYASKMRFQPDLDRQLNDMRDSKVPRMAKYAGKYYDYVMNPVEEHRFLRAMGFQWWLGGNLSSAALQTVSAFNFSGPMLASYTGMGTVKASGQILRAFKDAGKLLYRATTPKTLDPRKWAEHLEYRDLWMDFTHDSMPADFKSPEAYGDILQALHDGILKNFSVLEEQGLSPHARRLQILAGDKAGDVVTSGLRGLTTFLATPFNTMETYTRFTTYVAAHRAARDPKYRAEIVKALRNDGVFQVMLGDTPIDQFTPHQFASYMVEAALGVFGKDNRATFMRGHFAPIFQFQSYPLMMLELLSRSFRRHGKHGRKALANMVLATLLIGGLYGLPGADDADDLYDFLATQLHGEDPIIRAQFRDMLFDWGNQAGRTLGVDDPEEFSHFFADLFEFGLPGAMGVDIQRRVNLQIPGIDILKAASGVEGDVEDLLGLPGSTWISGTKSFATLAEQGRWGEAVPYAMPAAARNVWQAIAWQRMGVKSQRGQQLVTPEEYKDMSLLLQFGKSAGFTPMKVREARDVAHTITRVDRRVRTKQDRIVARMATAKEGILRAGRGGDLEAKTKHRAELQELIRIAKEHNDQVIANSQPKSYLLPLQSMLQSSTERAVQSIYPEARLRRANRRSRPEVKEYQERGLR